MHEQWEQKKRRSGGMSNPHIDEWYELGLKNGAIGGKLVGRRRRRLPPVLLGGPSTAPCRNVQGRPRGSAVPLRFRRDEGAAGVSLPVAMLAGGLATRLRPVTETIPKALVEVADKPFAVHQLELLAAARSDETWPGSSGTAPIRSKPRSATAAGGICGSPTCTTVRCCSGPVARSAAPCRTSALPSS